MGFTNLYATLAMLLSITHTHDPTHAHTRHTLTHKQHIQHTQVPA